jgi:hypothetical protein
VQIIPDHRRPLLGRVMVRGFSKRKPLFPDSTMSRSLRRRTIKDARAARETNARKRQLILVHWRADTPPPLGLVLGIFKFELGHQSPKLNLMTVR